jgi:hypothetical protein
MKTPRPLPYHVVPCNEHEGKGMADWNEGYVTDVAYTLGITQS